MPKPLPEAVQRQAEAMEAYDKEVTAAAPAPAPTPPTPEATPPEPAAEPPPAPPPAEDWEQKYRTLQGKYNTEVPQLRAEVEELKKQVAAPPPTPEPAPAAQPAAPTKLVTEADVEAFGADLVDLIRRAARETDADVKAALQQEIADLKQRLTAQEGTVSSVAEVTAKTARDTYFENLTKACPEWQAINVNEDFKTWLSEADPLSGTLRDTLIKQAFDAFDHVRTAAIFNAFKGSAPAPVASPPAAPPPADPPTPAPQNELEAQITPDHSRGGGPITPDDGKKQWTSAEIHEFYNAVGRGDYRGRQAEMQQIDAQIDKALAEGRVRG